MLLRKLQSEFGKQIELLAGSGINQDNIQELREKTGIHQFHSSCKAWEKDLTTTVGSISYAYHDKDDYEFVSAEIVQRLAQSLKEQ